MKLYERFEKHYLPFFQSSKIHRLKENVMIEDNKYGGIKIMDNAISLQP